VYSEGYDIKQKSVFRKSAIMKSHYITVLFLELRILLNK